MVNWRKLAKKIPFRVQIARNTYYEVCYADDFPDGNTWGETRYEQKQIVLKKDLKPKNLVTTYIHEVLHAMSYDHGIELTEKQIESFEKSFYFFLKNGNIFKK